MTAHDELVEIGRRWLSNGRVNYSYKDGPASYDYRSACAVVVTEIVTVCRETPDVLGWHGQGSFLIECKTSRSDFKADAKKPMRKRPGTGMGDFRYMLTPKGLLATGELPDRWGLLEATPRGGVKIIRHAERQPGDKEAECSVLLSTLRRVRIDPDRSVSLRVYTLPTQNTASLTVTDATEETENG